MAALRAFCNVPIRCEEGEIEAMKIKLKEANAQPQASTQEPVALLRDAWATLHNLSADMDAGPIRQQMQKRARAIRVYLDSIENADGTYTAPQPQAPSTTSEK